ncbi:MAG: hypothetical protein CMH26_05605 [Micavibrio sp.]|nr:hypothetical protein [Micavibrio sp.]
MVWLELAIVALLICSVGMLIKLRGCYLKNKLRLGLLQEAGEMAGYGLVFFDERDRYVFSNERVYEILPIFASQLGRLKDLGGFVDYLFDHAVDEDESIRNTLREISMINDERGDFREVIHGQGGHFYLAEVRKLPNQGTAVVLSDISKLKQREDYLLYLSQFNYQLYQAIEAANNGIVVLQVNGLAHEVIFANKALCNVFRIDRQWAVGKKVNDLFSLMKNIYIEKDISTLIRKQEPAQLEICFNEGGDSSSVCWYNLELTPVYKDDENSGLYIGVFNDITTLKLNEAEISKAKKLEALGQMAAGVSHDFNNILSIVDGYARIAASSLDDGDECLGYIDKIRAASTRGANLVQQMLTFSRHQIVVDDVIDLNDALQSQKALLAPLLDARYAFRMTLTDGVVPVECKVDAISQILMNLVVNARDAMPDGGAVTVTSRVCDQGEVPRSIKSERDGGSYICLSVEDTGEGISEDVLSRIFDPFFTTKGGGKGTGLGLSMVYGLVNQLGGTIDVDTKLKEGSTFKVYIPISDKEVSKNSKGSLDDLETIRFDGYGVLLVEDEPDLLALVKQMLEKLGMNVLCASNGNEALVIQDDHEGKIDLMVTDCVMPELGGIELAEMMRSLRPDMEIIYMSGYPAKGAFAKVSLPDDAFFLAKPINYEALVTLIYKLLSGDHEGAGDVAGAAKWRSDDSVADEQKDQPEVMEG